MNLWTKWQQLAHKAAVVQSNILLFVVYFVLVVPVSFIFRVASKPRATGPGWQPISVSDDQKRSASQQF